MMVSLIKILLLFAANATVEAWVNSGGVRSCTRQTIHTNSRFDRHGRISSCCLYDNYPQPPPHPHQTRKKIQIHHRSHHLWPSLLSTLRRQHAVVDSSTNSTTELGNTNRHRRTKRRLAILLTTTVLSTAVALLFPWRSASAAVATATTAASSTGAAAGSATTATIAAVPSAATAAATASPAAIMTVSNPMSIASELRLTLRLVMAALLGATIGKERSGKQHHPAGVRTMALVSLGAATFTICSMYGFASAAKYGILRYDPSRMASNVASGVGFIGAGVITTTGSHETTEKGVSIVHGLTTAAAIWLSAAVGVGCGVGMSVLSACAALLTISVLRIGRAAQNWQERYEEEQEELLQKRREDAAQRINGGEPSRRAYLMDEELFFPERKQQRLLENEDADEDDDDKVFMYFPEDTISNNPEDEGVRKETSKKKKRTTSQEEKKKKKKGTVSKEEDLPVNYLDVYEYNQDQFVFSHDKKNNHDSSWNTTDKMDA